MTKLNDKYEPTIVKRGGGRHEHDEHGGAWKVAFADFCLALMALFLVLWLIATREQQHLQNVLRDAGASSLFEGQGHKQKIDGNPSGSLIERFPVPQSGTGAGQGAGTPSAPKTAYDSPSELAALSQALQQMSAESGLSSNLATVVTPAGLRVMLHDTDKQGMFMRGSALPTGRFARLLRKMGPLFAEMENQMLIVGHTDSSQYAGTDRGGFSNWTLSTNRAMAARAELLAGGMRARSVLQVAGMADQAPLDVADAAAGPNRRIELLILTRAQAASVASMFGKPGATEALTKDAAVSVPETAELKQLRSQLAK